MQCACSILSPVAGPALQHFSRLSHKRHDLGKNMIEYKMCFDFIYNFCLKHSHFEELSEIDKKCMLVFV
jgi:hypothetical protein